jgi:DNA mismatch endonuclease (patch repair protein)
MPATRVEFWQRKIDGNIARDETAVAALRAAGWRVLLIWECALRGPGKVEEPELVREAAVFIRNGDGQFHCLQGLRMLECAAIEMRDRR